MPPIARVYPFACHTQISISNFDFYYLGIFFIGVEALSSLGVGGNASYDSTRTAEEFIESFSDVLAQELCKKIKASKFLSLIADESTDIAVNKKLVLYEKLIAQGRSETH